MTRPRLLDLFCGAGGAAMGYHRAGFDVVGVDIQPQPHYPFPMVVADALDFLTWARLGQVAAIHASPPCQAYSVASNCRPGTRDKHPDLLAPTRAALEANGRPWVIENVPQAPMRVDYKLCGCMFGLGRLRRERWFETSWRGFDLRSPCHHPEPSITISTKGCPNKTGTRAEAVEAMGIDWMFWDRLGLAIPPAYTEYIGRQLLEEIRTGRRDD